MEQNIKQLIYNDPELKAIAAELLTKYKENLKTFDAIATGTLMNTAGQNIDIEDDSIILYFNLEKYWYYLENGPKPHFPPISVIEKWIEVKKIVPKPKGKRKIPSTKQLAFAICKSMQKGKRDINGQMKAYISRPAIRYMLNDNEPLINRFITRVSELLTEYTNQYITEII